VICCFVPFRTPAGFASGAPDMKLSVVLGFTTLVVAARNDERLDAQSRAVSGAR
jgi:hypothetical protein